jgi:hypothetical protein
MEPDVFIAKDKKNVTQGCAFCTSAVAQPEHKKSNISLRSHVCTERQAFSLIFGPKCDFHVLLNVFRHKDLVPMMMQLDAVHRVYWARFSVNPVSLVQS